MKLARQEIKFLLLISLGILLGEGVILYQKSVPHSWNKGKGSFQKEPSEVELLRIDINHANYKDLINIPEIGPVLARRIIAYRKKSGQFKNSDGLMNVEGIGEKKLEKMKPYIKCIRLF